MAEPITTVLTEFGFVLARNGMPLVGKELARLPEDLRPDMSYGRPSDAYHWSSRYRARRAAAWLTERGF